MSIKENFKKFRDNYVINQVKKIDLLDFEPDSVKRYKITFKGRVQKVGFRLEVCELAKRLNLTGYCKNLDNGDVLAELQGNNNKIMYLVSFMESLIRIKVKDKVIEDIDIIENEITFLKK